jgi:ankyrin repeat protein
MHHPVILKAFEKPATLFNTYLSVSTPDFGTVLKFIRKGADVNFEDEDGRTPLQLVSRHFNKQNILQLLISSGADVNRGSFI